jgi:hypothetical protein
MKNKSLRIRISERRLSRLQNYAVQADKTMTQVIEELLDTLPNTKNGDSSSTYFPVNPVD